MGKTTTIHSVNPVTVGKMRFQLEFEHRGGDGYWVSIAPWAKNTSPESEDKVIVLMGGDRNPGIAQKRIDNSKRYSAKVGVQLTVAAIYEAAVLIEKVLTDYRKKEFRFTTPAWVLSEMEGVDVTLLEQVAEAYFPMPKPPAAS